MAGFTLSAPLTPHYQGILARMKGVMNASRLGRCLLLFVAEHREVHDHLRLLVEARGMKCSYATVRIPDDEVGRLADGISGGPLSTLAQGLILKQVFLKTELQVDEVLELSKRLIVQPRSRAGAPAPTPPPALEVAPPREGPTDRAGLQGHWWFLALTAEGVREAISFATAIISQDTRIVGHTNDPDRVRAFLAGESAAVLQRQAQEGGYWERDPGGGRPVWVETGGPQPRGLPHLRGQKSSS